MFLSHFLPPPLSKKTVTHLLTTLSPKSTDQFSGVLPEEPRDVWPQLSRVEQKTILDPQRHPGTRQALGAPCPKGA